MDPLVIAGLAFVLLVLGAVVYFDRNSKSLDVDADGDVDMDDVRMAVNEAVEEVQEEVEETVKDVKEAVAKLPSVTKLKAMTKAQLEELGREFGVELDRRKKKDDMVASLKEGVKQQRK